MLSYLIGILVTGLTFYMSMLYKSTALALLGFSEALFVVLSFFYLLICRIFLKFDVKLPIPMVEKGEEATVSIFAENAGILPCPKLGFLMREGSAFYSRRKKRKGYGSVGSRADARTAIQVRPEISGKYVIALKKIRIYDLSGLFFWTVRSDRQVSLQVMPDIDSIAVTLREPVRNFFGEADSYDELRPGHDAGETFRIREFQNGDRMQNIHWKLSAKTDELMVRENSRPKACPVVLLLEGKTGKKREKPAHVNAFMQIAASISFSLMDAGCPHFMAWYSTSRKQVVRIRVDDEESFYQFLVYYIADMGEREPDGLLQRYREKYRSETVLYVLRLTRDLCLYSGEERWQNYHTEKISDELAGTELIL